MKILVLNCGSSSLKYQLIDMTTEEALAKGLVERINLDGARLEHRVGDQKIVKEADIPNHTVAVNLVIEALKDPGHGVISDISEVAAVGHRVVHGGEMFSGSVIITDAVKAALRECSSLAPLHNPPNLIGIEAAEALLSSVPQIGVFDTAFHQTMPPKAYLYGIPYSYYEKYKIRRYGFHGTSHKYVSARASEMLGKPIESLKIITCHLGNGASIAAVEGGRVVDTSMGMTPLEGLVMGTRCGDIDPAVVTFLMEKDGLSPKQMDDIMNKQSGVAGVSGVSSDFRDIEAAIAAGNEQAKTAMNLYVYRIAKYIGEYAAAMNGVDAIVFTAGVGENAPTTRADICAYLGYLGIKVDPDKNNVRGRESDFSAPGATCRSLVIPTNEELVIARDTYELVK